MKIYAALLSWLGLFAFYLKSVPGTFYFEDSPELLACASVLGNTHEPGYPLFALLGRLSFLVPAGCPAFRFNLLVAACGAAAAVVLGLLAAAVMEKWVGRAMALLLGVAAAFVAGLGDTFWWQASIGDKYPLFYLFFVLLLAASRGLPTGTGGAGNPLVYALLAGLAFAHHQYVIFALPLLVYAALRFRREAALAGRGRRIAVLVLAAFLLPFSIKLIYPPVRSAGSAALDWGTPSNAGQLVGYLAGRRYYEAFASETRSRGPSTVLRRAGFIIKRTVEEIPAPFLLLAPVGTAALWSASPGFALVAGISALLDFIFVVNVPNKAVRWLEPFLLLLVFVSILGVARVVAWFPGGRRVRMAAAVIAVLLATGAAGWQFAKNTERNDLSRFYSAHDMARHILLSIPPEGIYLGRGDTDLFPLWAAKHTEGMRSDVESFGLAAFADAHPADALPMRRVLRRYGIRPRGGTSLKELLAIPGAPVFIAKTGYEGRLWDMMGELVLHKASGLTGELVREWDIPGGYEETRRVMRGYTFRGVLYRRAGAVFDLNRVRDEMARDALLMYPASLGSMGTQCLHFGNFKEAAWAFHAGRPLIEALAGPTFLPGSTRAGPSFYGAAMLNRRAYASGYSSLAAAMRREGMDDSALSYQNTAAFFR